MLSFTLLNQAQITHNNIPLTQFRSQKEAALLIYLAYTKQIHSREFIAELLWESSTTKQSLTNLRTALARLKKQVGDDVLLITRKTVGLAPEMVSQVDAINLLKTLNDIGKIDTAEKATLLQNALTTYHGKFLADFNLANAAQFNQWITITREQIHRQVIDAYDKLGQFALQKDEPELGLKIADNWLEVDHLNEAAQSLRIKLLLETNQTREAMAEFNNFTDLLQAELGVGPPEELSDLVQKAQPESQTTPVRRPQTAVRHNLPPTFDQFFGRHNEQEEIHTRMDQPWCRLVTLVGQGGAGKTRLATTLARSRLDQYRDGVWFIELANLDPDDEDLAETIAVEIAIALDLRLTGSDTPIEQILNHLQYKQMLLVLDNFEHVLPGKQMVLDMIQRCEGVQMIVTTREALRLRAEWAITLDGLTYPANGSDDEPSTAVELFIARRAQQQWDDLTDDETNAIRAICKMVEGLPLAIELAAALTRYDSCQQIATRLQDSFDALKATLDDVPERHRGMVTVFEMSWQTLTPALQQRLAQLAYFRGGFDKTAVSQINNTTSQHLTALAEKSLLTHSRATQRYRIHPVIRAYAQEFRPSTDKTLQKHTHYYLNLLAGHAEPIQKEKPQDSIALLEPDIENIRLAWQTGLELALAEALLNALTTISTYYQLRGLALEGEAVMQATVNTATAWGDEGLALATRAGLEHGRFQNRLGRYRPAIQTLKKTLTLAEQTNDRWAEGMAHVWWGESLWRLGEYELAKTKLNFALGIANSISEQKMLGWGHHQIGIIHDIQSHPNLALEHLTRARKAWEKLNSSTNLSITLNSIGIVLKNLGNLFEAKQIMEAALEICSNQGNRYLEAMLLNNLSSLLMRQEDYFGAQYYLQLGLELASVTGSLHSQCDIYLNLGENHLLQAELDLATQNFEIALEIAKLIINRLSIALALTKLGHIKKMQGHETEAEKFYIRAKKFAQKDKLIALEFEILVGLIELFKEIDSTKTNEYLQAILTFVKSNSEPNMIAQVELIKHEINQK